LARADPEVAALSDQVNHAIRHIQIHSQLAMLLGKLSSNRSYEVLAQCNTAGDPQISPWLALIANECNGFVSLAYQPSAMVEESSSGRRQDYSPGGAV